METTQTATHSGECDQTLALKGQRDLLEAENERLRAALTNMVTDHPFVLDGDNGAMVASWFIHEAKQALGQG